MQAYYKTKGERVCHGAWQVGAGSTIASLVTEETESICVLHVAGTPGAPRAKSQNLGQDRMGQESNWNRLPCSITSVTLDQPGGNSSCARELVTGQEQTGVDGQSQFKNWRQRDKEAALRL